MSHVRSYRWYAGRRLVAIAALFVVVVVSAPVEAATPKPWQWTPVQAAAKLDIALDQARALTVDRLGRAEPSKCRGVGRQAVRGRWLSFACTFPYRVGGLSPTTASMSAWVRVRTAGSGGACISFKSATSLRPACLKASGLVAGDPAQAFLQVQLAAAQRFGRSRPLTTVNSPNECVGVDGFYECTFSSGMSGTATVAFRATGVTVRLTSITCVPDVATEFPQACTFPP